MSVLVIDAGTSSLRVAEVSESCEILARFSDMIGSMTDQVAGSATSHESGEEYLPGSEYEGLIRWHLSLTPEERLDVCVKLQELRGKASLSALQPPEVRTME